MGFFRSRIRDSRGSCRVMKRYVIERKNKCSHSVQGSCFDQTNWCTERFSTQCLVWQNGMPLSRCLCHLPTWSYHCHPQGWQPRLPFHGLLAASMCLPPDWVPGQPFPGLHLACGHKCRGSNPAPLAGLSLTLPSLLPAPLVAFYLPLPFFLGHPGKLRWQHQWQVWLQVGQVMRGTKMGLNHHEVVPFGKLPFFWFVPICSYKHL